MGDQAASPRSATGPRDQVGSRTWVIGVRYRSSARSIPASSSGSHQPPPAKCRVTSARCAPRSRWW
ncbi:hypothetical protein XF36_17475 [Pseudonocardia sp. HH130629-09]|nr:hypothetical protein XF36_17475 [Pseudonocardia sp. HH130629-09]